MSNPKARSVSGPQIVQIAAAIMANPRTVERVYDGRGNVYSRERVTRAALELGFPVPERAAPTGGA
jgi:hypothetical protein